MKNPPLFWLSAIKKTLLCGVMVTWSCVNAYSTTLVESFDSEDFPEDWEVRNNGGTPDVSMASFGDGYVLKLARTGGGTGMNSAVYYTRSTGEIVGGKIADFSLSVNMAFSHPTTPTSTVVGVMIRANQLAYSPTQGYFIGFIPTGESSMGLGLWTPTHTHIYTLGGAAISDAFSSALVTNTLYQLNVDAIGSTIQASLWSLTEEGVADTELASIVYNGATNVDAGYFGLRLGAGNSNVSGLYQDFELQVIPEAGVGILLLGAGALLGMMRGRRRSGILTSVMTSAVLAVSLSTGEAGRLSESFSAPEGGVPEHWEVKKTMANADAHIALSPEANDTALLIQRPGGASANAAVFYTGSEDGAPSGEFMDFTATVTIRLLGEKKQGTNGYYGIMARATVPAYKDNQGYFVAFQPVGATRELGIYYNPKTHIEHGETVVSTPLQEELLPGQAYILEVKFEGVRLEANLWSTNDAGGKADLLATVVEENAEHVIAGYFGLRGAYGNSGPQGAYFSALHLNILE